jgi:hypothetical protein
VVEVGGTVVLEDDEVDGVAAVVDEELEDADVRTASLPTSGRSQRATSAPPPATAAAIPAPPRARRRRRSWSTPGVWRAVGVA